MLKIIRSWFTSTKCKASRKSPNHLPINPPEPPRSPETGKADSQETQEPIQNASSPTIYSAIKVGMELMKEVSSTFPPLESVIRGLTFILEHHEKWQANQEVIKCLINRVKALRAAFRAAKDNGESEDEEVEARRTLMKRLNDIAAAIKTMTAKHRVSSYVAAADDADALSQLMADIRDALMDYQAIVQQELSRRIESLTNHQTSDENRILCTLPRAHARHSSDKRKGCLLGTRTDILNELESWAESEDPRSMAVFWLTGHAGSGKTTISQSFCQQAYALGRLGASFFCSLDYTDRSDLQRIFPTLAFQLSFRFPAFKACIIATLNQSPDIGLDESLQTQLMELIIRPFQKTKISTIIVIDALDECIEDESTSKIISLLSDHIHKLPSVRFFVTSRPEHHIRVGFRSKRLQPVTKTFHLYDINVSHVDSDIRLFLKSRLPAAVTGRSDLNLPSPWPSDHDVQLLTSQAQQLFIYAATAVIFITEPYHPPEERLALLLAMPEKNRGIDNLYRVVLVNGYADNHEDQYWAIWRLLIGSIVLAFDPISRGELAAIHNLTPHRVLMILRPLHAVLNIPETDDGLITTYHKSFSDYITDSTRCLDSRFFIDPSTHHAALAQKCLQIVIEHREKVAVLGAEYALSNYNDNEWDHDRILQPVLEPASGYSYRYWERHLSNTPGTCFNPRFGLLIESILTDRRGLLPRNIFYHESQGLISLLSFLMSVPESYPISKGLLDIFFPHCRSEKRAGCLDGTRVDILNKLDVWAEDPASNPIFWVCGHAGSGKSEIAQSFSQRMFTAGRLGGSFFCSDDYFDMDNPRIIFSMLAFQLAYQYPSFKACVVATLKQFPLIAQESLAIQVEELLVKPLQKAEVSTIIIIDALDQCTDNGGASTILSLLAQDMGRMPLVKFFLTGRPEPPIRSCFHSPQLQSLTTVVVLYEVNKASVDSDIRRFLKYRLAEVAKNRSDMDLSAPWPSDSDIKKLTSQAGQLFVYAATVITFISEHGHQPAERLALLTANPAYNRGIDRLYRFVLTRGYGDVDNDYQSIWLLIVGSIILAFNPVSRGELAALFNLSPQKVASLLRPLHSVLNVPESDEGKITTYHISFSDFMTDPTRCSQRIFIDADAHHVKLARHCLETLEQHLDPTIDRNQFPLKYALTYLPEHLKRCTNTPSNVELGPPIERLLSHNSVEIHLPDAYNVLVGLRNFLLSLPKDFPRFHQLFSAWEDASSKVLNRT